jgi:hypothetical protein
MVSFFKEKVLTSKKYRSLKSRINNTKKFQLPSGLPDGLFSDQKIPIWVYFVGPC